MQKKIEVSFPHDFESNQTMAIPLARIHIGNHVGRFMLTPEGKTVLYIGKSAKEDGSIFWGEEAIDGLVLTRGFK
jgi:hypothetical protein